MKTIKSELIKLLSEAMYLGITSDQLVEIIKEVEYTIGGGSKSDSI